MTRNETQLILSELRYIRGSVDELKEDMVEVKQDIGVLKKDVVELKQDIVVLKEDVTELKQEMRESIDHIEVHWNRWVIASIIFISVALSVGISGVMIVVDL